jgi:hypothetical protein
MFEAYRIGVILSAADLISPQLGLLAEEFKKLEALAVSLNQKLRKIEVDSAGLRSLTTATNASNRAFERAAVSAEAYERRLGAIHQLGAMPPPVMPRLPPPGGRPPGQGGGASGGHGGAGPMVASAVIFTS